MFIWQSHVRTTQQMLGGSRVYPAQGDIRDVICKTTLRCLFFGISFEMSFLYTYLPFWY